MGAAGATSGGNVLVAEGGTGLGEGVGAPDLKELCCKNVQHKKLV